MVYFWVKFIRSKARSDEAEWVQTGNEAHEDEIYNIHIINSECQIRFAFSVYVYKLRQCVYACDCNVCVVCAQICALWAWVCIIWNRWIHASAVFLNIPFHWQVKRTCVWLALILANTLRGVFKTNRRQLTSSTVDIHTKDIMWQENG